MPIDPDILADNAASLDMLERVASQPHLLNRQFGNDWTVAVMLAHLAFWDRRVVRLLGQWEREGKRPDDIDDDLLNQSLLDEWRALAPDEAARLAVEAAGEVNRAVESVSDQVVTEAMASGWERLLRRNLHRNEHLGEIEVA